MTSLVFIDDTRSLACGSSNGTVHVLCVSTDGRGHRGRGADMDRFGASASLNPSQSVGSAIDASTSSAAESSPLSVQLVTELRFDDEGEVMALRHVNTPHASLLLCATQRWRVHG